MANSHPEPFYGGRHPGQPIQPTITQEEAALQELMDLITDTMKKEGVNTLGEFSKFRMHFEEITDFLYSRGLSSHSDQFTKCFWNCLSPRLQDAITVSLVFNGHIILNANFLLEELPPYSILVEYIHRSFIPKGISHEVPSRLSSNLENQQPDQSVPIVMSSKEGYGENRVSHPKKLKTQQIQALE
ncbi:hypothetical protein PSTG_11854 [Puccinia striiformis f. sp. tritici PST-78]|uniref:Uncharacterized protein n=1 Tax=Puccinia striiformis f. sp. tritici PST-78 TaxID=1165861 RepID=A0A0L0V6E2_9BASI|nr:hypothetical protein PSTG_11854 [Puccinia striiformis f. sp. tritici PST-78]